MKTNMLIVCLAVLVFSSCQAQQGDTPNRNTADKPSSAPAPYEPWVGKSQDSLIFMEKIGLVKGNSMPERCLSVGRAFIGTPYRAHTLEVADPEQVVVNLRGLDCWTLMDVALAMALVRRDSMLDFYAFVQKIRHLRYKNGIVDGYGSRLHYFSDWLLHAAELGYGRDITQELGGVPLQKTVDFITDNPKLYPRSRDSSALAHIKTAQERINAHTWYHIPKAQVPKIENQIQEGDILVLTSIRGNLDVEHQGFAVRDEKGALRFLHASSTTGRVVVSHREFPEYLMRIKAVSGVMVFRLF
jgi:hypothetical protein